MLKIFVRNVVGTNMNNIWEDLKYPYKEYAEFLDTQNIAELVDKYYENDIHPMCDFSSMIRQICNPIYDVYQKWIKDNGMKINKKEDLFHLNSLEFWQLYFNRKLNLDVHETYVVYREIWEYNKKLNYYKNNCPKIKYMINNAYININDKEYAVGVVLGPEGDPNSPFASEIVTVTEYEKGLKNKIYGPCFINNLTYYTVCHKNKDNVYEMKQKWLDELVKLGVDTNSFEYKII